MVTPINKDYSIDTESVEGIISTFLKEGCAPFILGTTGESTSLSNVQKLALAKATVEATAGKEKIFAGISSTSLFEAIDQARAYRDLGVDVMVTTLPYYYPITPAEMIKFFTQLADHIACPLILYNMPAMVGERISLEVADELSHHPYIVGMKDSERDPVRIDNSIELWKNRDDFGFYLGWAAQSAYSLLKGADGIVPSTANFVPKLFKELYEAARSGDADTAYKLQELTDEISLIYQKNRKLNTSLPALKVLMEALNLCNSYVIPPMYNIVQDEQLKLKTQIGDILKKIKV